jgi:hypothetical protein
MGIRYEQHDSLCGCRRCAVKCDNGNDSPTFDAIEDPNYLDCGCHVADRCTCDDEPPPRYDR